MLSNLYEYSYEIHRAAVSKKINCPELHINFAKDISVKVRPA